MDNRDTQQASRTDTRSAGVETQNEASRGLFVVIGAVIAILALAFLVSP